MNYFGFAVLGICAGAVIWSLVADEVPAKWPMTAIRRADNPVGFWLLVGLYGAGCFGGLLIALSPV